MKVSPTEEERSLVLDSRAVGNRAPDKRKAMHRIDGTVALVMGLAMAPIAGSDLH